MVGFDKDVRIEVRHPDFLISELRCSNRVVDLAFRGQDELLLLDLKGLLKEARQRIPPVLEMLEDPRTENTTGVGCSFCGGLGHTILTCPKIEKDAKRIQRSHHDALQMGGGEW